MGQFSAGPINKAARSFRNSLTEYVKDDERHFERFLYSESVHIYGLMVDSFVNVTTAGLP